MGRRVMALMVIVVLLLLGEVCIANENNAGLTPPLMFAELDISSSHHQLIALI